MSRNVYMDCEFTGLNADDRLISIALVEPVSDTYLYVEMADGWSPSDCGDWVQANVVGKLEGGGVRMTRAEAADAIRGFLGRFSEAVVCFDSELDRGMLLGLICEVPAGCRLENINTEVDDLVWEGYWSGAETFQHHALTDSRGLAYCHQETMRTRVEAMKAGYDTF